MVLVLSPEGEEGSSGCGDAAASLGDELDFFFPILNLLLEI